ncbi:transmembrane 70 mitochondrial [Brachionus plicatilis]|uniref:Transmembrane 70 mitochondrial n=1 Tax=Brachionus plicatilis TaxID=10195 RepID=A0A3M7SBM8_BRAPC|nr:transmembrane 70 mitochondrial [Brachionus plicatilis]
MSLILKCVVRPNLLLKNCCQVRTISLKRPVQNTNDGEDEERRMRMEMMSPKIKKYLEEEKKYNGKLVYVGQLTKQLKTAKFLSLSSSLLGIMLMPFLTDSLSTSSIFAQFFVFGTTGFFIFVTPMFSQFLGRRYVSRLYYNYEEKKFKAILLSFLMNEYKLEFSLDDVFVPDIPGPFSTVKLRQSNRNLFIDVHQLQDDELIQKIYGYDKPFDFKKYSEKQDD